MELCRVLGVSIYLYEQSLDTVSSNGTSMFDVAAMMAFHLRQSRRDQILRVRLRPVTPQFGPISGIKVEKAKRLLADGQGVRQTARLAGISPASVSRLKGASAQASAGA